MTLLYRERRGQGPPLLLLHATLSSSRQLRSLATRLATAHTVVSVDRRGSGQSTLEGPARPIEVATHVEDLALIIEAEELGPVALVGHSFGGCVALELAARHPQLVRAVFAYEPPYALVGPPAVQADMAEVGQRTLSAHDHGGPAAAALTFMEAVSGAEAVAALSPAARARVELAGQGAVADATLLGMDPDALDRLSCPVRIVTGAASAAFYAHISEALAARIPAGDHQRLDGLDHMAPVLRPEPIADAIEEFLA
jgi:pimeloyl-ACP methyl ester carboxylesterase